MTGDTTSARFSRRRLLTLGGLGAAAAAVGGWSTWQAVGTSGSGDTAFAEPPVLASSGGVLDVTLEAAPGVTLAGRSTRALGYNGGSPGPTLLVRAGDTLRVSLRNRLDRPTNLHTHGLHVSPEGRSDNVFRVVRPGESADYEYLVPEDHPAGTFWYHPHHHGTVTDQVFGGLLGAIVVAGPDDPTVDRDRVLVVSDTTLTGDGTVAPAGHMDAMLGREGELVLVNGVQQPTLEVVAGSTERWRVVNTCVSRFLDLRLDGHSWQLLGYDGQALQAPRARDRLLLAPGNRVDVLVSPAEAGSTILRTLAHDRGDMGMGMGMGMGGSGGGDSSSETVLANVVVGSSGGSTRAVPWAGPGAAVPDLRGAVVDRSRTVTMTGGTMGMGMTEFGFDGQTFDPARVDQRLQLGTVEEWTLVNTTTMDHPFHLHVWPMQLLGSDPDPPDWRDVVIVPARAEVTVRVPIRDHGGRTVYHCHILDHEDLGMMGVVEAS
mgnify:FL=1